MTALPDTFMPDGPLRQQREIPAHHIETSDDDLLRRVALRLGAVAALAAAVGLWMVPATPDDALMQLVKLAASGLLAVGGVALMTRAGRRDGLEVQIDTTARRLSIIERDARGNMQSRRCYPVDGLQEIVLRDHMLTARDAQGDPLFALPVTDPAVEAALLRMLA